MSKRVPPRGFEKHVAQKSRHLWNQWRSWLQNGIPNRKVGDFFCWFFLIFRLIFGVIFQLFFQWFWKCFLHRFLALYYYLRVSFWNQLLWLKVYRATRGHGFKGFSTSLSCDICVIFLIFSVIVFASFFWIGFWTYFVFVFESIFEFGGQKVAQISRKTDAKILLKKNRFQGR